MRTVSLACALVLATASVARAQDPARVDAKHYQVLIDNARTRVFRVVVGPGEKVPMHEHPDAIMIPLTVPPTRDGSPAPAAFFMSAQKHGGDNPGTTPVDFIYVELKGDAAPTAVVPSNRPGINSTRLVEHAKADAIRSTADTGFSEPAGTTHDYDQVVVALGDAELSLTVDGKTTNTWKRGDVAFIGRNESGRTDVDAAHHPEHVRSVIRHAAACVGEAVRILAECHKRGGRDRAGLSSRGGRPARGLEPSGA